MPTHKLRPFNGLSTFELSCSCLLLSAFVPGAIAFASNPEHFRRGVPSLPLHKRDGSVPLIITNNCGEAMWPAVNTQFGTGPAEQGFALASGDSKTQSVSPDWQGRVWCRTNCTFPNTNPGRACATGDCAGQLNCVVGGDTPATLAEITMMGFENQTYYDLSLVDGFNLPVAIVLKSDQEPSNRTNPACVGSVSLLNDNGNPYANGGEQQILSSNSSFPIQFTSQSRNDILHWCPWDLQVTPPQKPGDGIYPYPDDNIQRPVFNPCFSTCSKYHDPSDCCTGQYNSVSACKGGYYSQQAKSVCPDAYSYAYDDRDSTFAVPHSTASVGIEVVFCPGGRSTNILAFASPKVDQAQKSKAGGQVMVDHAVQSSASGVDVVSYEWIVMCGALVFTAGIFAML